ncbi:MAG: DUF4232 domain-containing protein [Acidimicrobiales bacterium]
MLIDYPMCPSSQLNLSLTRTLQEVEVLYVTFGFSNVGTSPCSLFGYPGFQPLSADGQPIPSEVVRTNSPGSTFVGKLTGGVTATPQFTVVNPGQTVYFQVAYSNVCSGSGASGGLCASANSIQVWPPNQRTPLSVALQGSATQFADQAAPIRIDVSPVYPTQ